MYLRYDTKVGSVKGKFGKLDTIKILKFYPLKGTENTKENENTSQM